MAQKSIGKATKRLKRLRKDKKKIKESSEPPPCECEPISWGCRCGRFEYEMWLKEQQPEQVQYRDIAFDPQSGDVYTISRPPNSNIDHGEVPFRVWAKCEGKRVEVILIEPDEKLEDFWWCWADVSDITKNLDDCYWFPCDGLLKNI